MPRMTTQPRAIHTLRVNQSEDLYEALELSSNQIDHFDLSPSELADLMPSWHIFQPQDQD